MVCNDGEQCNEWSGECMCGNNPSCADNPWAPTCFYQGVNSWTCRCGNEEACNQDTEICVEEESKCNKGDQIVN